MKIELERTISYFDVKPDFSLHLGAVFRAFQEAAMAHSEKVGAGSRALVESGSVWVLNKIGAEIYRYPTYGETLSVTTWSRGAKGFKAFRDFVLHAGDETLAAATSLWLFYDMGRGRIIRVPQQAMAAFTVETETVLGLDIDAWKPETAFDPDRESLVTVRTADFDPLGHVNNSRYVDYVETFLAGIGPGSGMAPVCGFNIRFLKEIGPGISQVRVQGDASNRNFRIVSDQAVHADGDLRF